MREKIKKTLAKPAKKLTIGWASNMRDGELTPTSAPRLQRGGKATKAHAKGRGW